MNEKQFNKDELILLKRKTVIDHFEIGDFAELNSGSPLLMVEYIDGNNISVVWTIDNIQYRDIFDVRCLTKI